MATEYSQRPSSLLGLQEDSYVAWCIDEVTFMWGMHVEATLEEASTKGKTDQQKAANRQRAMTSLMTEPVKDDEPKPVPKGRFRDPVSMMGGKRNG